MKLNFLCLSLLLLFELTSFLNAAKNTRFYCKKGCEGCGKETQKTRQFSLTTKYPNEILESAFGKVVQGGYLCESCDRALRKSVQTKSREKTVSFETFF